MLLIPSLNLRQTLWVLSSTAANPRAPSFFLLKSSGVITSEETQKCWEKGSSVQSGIYKLLLEPSGGSLAMPVPVRDWEDALFLPDQCRAVLPTFLQT